MSNTVTLTFAGDTAGAEQAFDRVGGGARDMGRKVEEAGDSFDRAAEKSDTLDTRAMGFRDTLTGIQDGAEGVKRAASGDWGFETLLLLGFGIGDLASGFTNALIPAVKSMRTAQLGLNTAFLTSPLTWIILAIAALVAIIVVIATKTDWFQRAWRASWGWIKNAAGAAWDWIKNKALGVWNWLQGIPGRLKSAFSTVASIITAPYRFAFNAIARLWNNTIGRLSWTVPSWIPGIGGNTIGAPKLPKFHSGGVVPGVPGSEVMAILQAGERVSPATSNGSISLEIHSGGSRFDDALVEVLANAIRVRGGNVQLVLGVNRG